MDLLDVYKYLIGGYYGVSLIDEYELKVYVLKDIEKYINDFINENKIDIDIEIEKEVIKKEFSLRTKLQDSLDILPKIMIFLKTYYDLKCY